MRRLRWTMPERQTPKHPIRDSAIVYAGFAVVIVAVSVATGGSIVRAAVIALLFYVAVMAWAVVTWRRKLRQGERS
jgi:Flp pilus assembly protein TadB